jgi:hypothetical protein
MPKKPDEYGLLLNRAGPLCEALAAKGYVAVLGQAVHVFAPAPPSGNGDGPAHTALGVPIVFFAPASPPVTLYLTRENAEAVAAQVEAIPSLALSRLILPESPLQA